MATEGAVLSNRQRRMMKQGRVRSAPRAPNVTEVVRHQEFVSKLVIEPENLRWFVAEIESGKEQFAVRVLEQSGIPSAVPTVARVKVRQGKIFRWRTPVVHGYILLGFPGSDVIPWHEIERFRIVYDVLKIDGRRMQVPWRCSYFDGGKMRDGGVETLLADTDAVRVSAAKYMRQHPAFEAGEKIRVETGPFAGHEGSFQNATDKRVRLLLTILGRLTPVEISMDEVVKAA